MALPELPTELWLTILALAADVWTDEHRLSHEGITKRWISIGGFSTRKWYNMATPYLYNRFTLLPDQTFSLSAATNYASHLNIFDWNAYLATKAEIEVQNGNIEKQNRLPNNSLLYSFLPLHSGNLMELEIDDLVSLTHAVSCLKNLRILKVGIRGTTGSAGPIDCIGRLQSLVRLELVWRGLYHLKLTGPYSRYFMNSSHFPEGSGSSQTQFHHQPSQVAPAQAQTPPPTPAPVTLPNLYELVITRTTHQNAARSSPCSREVAKWSLPSLRICSVDHFADWATLRAFNAQITHMEALQKYGGAWKLLSDIQWPH